MDSYKKRDNETLKEYEERVLNPISNSFCGAKWYNSTIWLNNGTTTSCHHPPPHKIPLDELKESHKALHNTKQKKDVRKQMLMGFKPEECDYCWKIESSDLEAISDRVYKSIIYSEDELMEAKTKWGFNKDVPLKTLEIAFDSNCNLACSYCSPLFSTKWQEDIQKNGPYENLISDGFNSGIFLKDHTYCKPYDDVKENPYFVAFWKWWEEELQYSLQELKITGGEPMKSPHFWKLMNWWESNPNSNIFLGVSTNLCLKEKELKKFLNKSKKIKNVILYTSCEAVGVQAEYIRDGMKWGEWLSNVYHLNENGKFKSITIMLTINALCLFSLTDFLDEMLKIKKKYGIHGAFLTFNLLRFPSFQSVTILPKEIREDKANQIKIWIEKNYNGGKNGFIDVEKDNMIKLVGYLKGVDNGHNYNSSYESRIRDFKNFHLEYDKRRNKNFLKTFPELKTWWENIKT